MSDRGLPRHPSQYPVLMWHEERQRIVATPWPGGTWCERCDVIIAAEDRFCTAHRPAPPSQP